MPRARSYSRSTLPRFSQRACAFLRSKDQDLSLVPTTLRNKYFRQHNPVKTAPHPYGILLHSGQVFALIRVQKKRCLGSTKPWLSRRSSASLGCAPVYCGFTIWRHCRFRRGRYQSRTPLPMMTFKSGVMSGRQDKRPIYPGSYRPLGVWAVTPF